MEGLSGSSLTGSFSHNLSFFYFRPLPLRFNKVAPARNDSSALCLSLSSSFRTGMRVPLGYERGLTVREELEKFQPCNVLGFSHSAQEKIPKFLSHSPFSLDLLSSLPV